MLLVALGPLRLSHEDAWRMTWGEIEDLAYAWRYAEFLETQKRAQLGAWIMNATGNLKRPVRVEDLSGFWVDGEVLSKNEYHEHQKQRIRARKGAVKHG
jgi:hypothetical protein